MIEGCSPIAIYIETNRSFRIGAMNSTVYRTAFFQRGTHAARRTFVVHALEEGMSPQIVMTFTGHEDYDSLKPYIAITDKTRKNLMTTMFSK